MIARRAFYYAQAVAAFALPAWLLVGWSLFGGGGITLLLVILGAVLLAVAMLVIGGITIARRSVRTERAVSWIDVGILSGLYLALIATGLYSAWGALLITAVLLLLGAGFWAAVAQLVSETGRRVRTAFGAFSAATSAPRPASFPTAPPRSTRQAPRSPYADGEYIVIETAKDRTPKSE